jgi:hypothetical protein
MDDAAVEANVSIQYCMTLPQHLLNAVTDLRAVTSTRVSGDGGRPYCRHHEGPNRRTNRNALFVLTSSRLAYADGSASSQLLVAALGLRAFKDNAWTSGVWPKGLADVAGSVLAMGPVGLADKLNMTNATLAVMSCAADGASLRASPTPLLKCAGSIA